MSNSHARHICLFHYGRRGSIFILTIGVLFVIGISAFYFSFLARSRIRSATLYDQRETARYYLESYAGDLIFQLRNEANKPGSTLFKQFREALQSGAEQKVDSSFYEKTGLLQTVEAGLPGSHRVFPPSIKFSAPQALRLPEMFDTSQYNGVEYESKLTVICSVELDGTRYDLQLEYPFRVVGLLMPMLREFVFFADSAHLEQPSPYKPDDKINVVNIHTSSAGHDGSGWPMVIGPNMAGGDEQKNGKIFMGTDDRPIYLNMAGERHFRGIRPDGSFDGGLMADLWQISSTFLDAVNPTNMPFVNQAVFQKQDGSWFSMRAIYVATDITSVVKIGVLGFSDENTNTSDGHFVHVDERLKFHAMLNGDPAFDRLGSGGGNAAFSASMPIKPLGLSREVELSENQRYPGPSRQIFGNVFGRFFQISFFSTSRDSTPAGNGILTYGSASPISYFQPLAGTRYEQYMTRVISNGLDFQAGGALPADYYPINRDDSLTPALLHASDYDGTDNLRLSGRFSDYARQWLGTSYGASDRIDNAIENIWGRVGREFDNQQEFKKFAGYDSGKFYVDGVVYVSGDLDLSEGIKTSEVKGGIVIVDGNITLGDVCRGVDFNISQQLEKAIDDLTADQILTFIALGNNSKINLKGRWQLGVHLVNLDADRNTVATQVAFAQGQDNIQLYGGIAVNTPNFEEMTKGFSRDYAYMQFVPAMADNNLPFSVQVSLNPEFYRLSANN